VELAFLTLLLKDGADSIGGGVAVNYKWIFETWLTEDGSHTNGIDECLKGGFVFIFPMESTALSTKCDERIEGGHQ
jgi:hypothetical protein